MSVHMAYEVRVMRNTGWRVEGVFDDEAIAVLAAKKVEARAGKSPVVVIHEVYDAARNHLKSRSIYRSSNAAPSVMQEEAGTSAAASKKSLPRKEIGGLKSGGAPRPSRQAPAEIWPWLAALAAGFALMTLILSLT